MILLASGDAAVLNRWVQALPPGGATVRRASTLAELEGTLAGRRPEVLLLDLALPELRRVEGLKELQSFSPATRVMAMAAVPDDDEAVAALRAGVRGYCNLYMDPRLLAHAVETVRAGEVWVGRRLVDRLIEALSQSRMLVHVAATEGTSAALDTLSPRERQIARFIGQGASNKVIARELKITERTVKAHLSAVFDKLGVRDRLQLALLMNGHMGAVTGRNGTVG